MFICNTGLDCSDCIGECENNLEWDEEAAILELERDMCTFINMKLHIRKRSLEK